MIKHSISYFFKYFIGFLGMWRAFEESNFSTNCLNIAWNEAVSLVKVFNNDSIGYILNKIKDKFLLNQDLDFFKSEEILKSLTDLFLEYYRKDFLRLIY